MATKEQYDEAFARERANEYPVINAFEHRCGHAVSRAWLEAVARVLACPVKVNPPNWQHGRVIYAALRRRLETVRAPPRCLDIGTAKGFSALVARLAILDAGLFGLVTSVDVVDPEARTARNTVAEVDGLLTLAETIDAITPLRDGVVFLKASGVDYLRANDGPVCFAFVDGKHSYEVVREEAELLKEHQQPGDVVVFDDVHIPGVWRAVSELTGYEIERLTIKAERAYAVARRT